MNSCIEKKITLSGGTETYQCELLSLKDGVGVLRYVIDRSYDIAGHILSPGDITFAVYWQGRPYTLYVWLRREQRDRSYYFNIADSVLLRPEEFLWRDLVVDILVDSAAKARVLDEHELPHDLPPDLLEYIVKAKEHVLTNFRDIIEEADKLIEATLCPGDTDPHGL
jgi:hypothetical protein